MIIIFAKGGSGSGNFGHSGIPGQVGGSGGFSVDSYKQSILSDLKFIDSKGIHPVSRAQKLAELLQKNRDLYAGNSIDSDTSDKVFNLLNSKTDALVGEVNESAKNALIKIIKGSSSPEQLQIDLDSAKETYCSVIKKLSFDKTVQNLYNDAISGRHEEILASLDKKESNPKDFDYGNALKTNNELEIIKILDNSLKSPKMTQNAIYLYEDTSVCSEINNSLINGYSDSYKDEIKTIDRGMKSQLLQDTILTRNVSGRHPMALAIDLGKDAVGTVYTEPNYASTSMNYNNEFGGKDAVRIRILAPKGSKGMSFSHNLELSYPDELEFCLPRGCSFKVTAMNYDTREVYVELIDNGVTK